MKMLLSVLPFFAFALIDRLGGSMAGVIGGAVVSVLLLVRSSARGQRPAILEIGSAVLFCGLLVGMLDKQPADSIIAVRFIVSSGLLLILLGSMAFGAPLPVQERRNQVLSEAPDSTRLIRASYAISSVWALAFAIVACAEFALLFFSLPRETEIVAVSAAMIGAGSFTALNLRGARVPGD